jgi:hypothetical protein
MNGQQGSATVWLDLLLGCDEFVARCFGVYIEFAIIHDTQDGDSMGFFTRLGLWDTNAAGG